MWVASHATPARRPSPPPPSLPTPPSAPLSSRPRGGAWRAWRPPPPPPRRSGCVGGRGRVRLPGGEAVASVPRGRGRAAGGSGVRAAAAYKTASPAASGGDRLVRRGIQAATAPPLPIRPPTVPALAPRSDKYRPPSLPPPPLTPAEPTRQRLCPPRRQRLCPPPPQRWRPPPPLWRRAAAAAAGRPSRPLPSLSPAASRRWRRDPRPPRPTHPPCPPLPPSPRPLSPVCLATARLAPIGACCAGPSVFFAEWSSQTPPIYAAAAPPGGGCPPP